MGKGKANLFRYRSVKRIRLSGGGYHEKPVNYEKNALKSDSRGCSIYSGSFRNPESKIETPLVGMVPAYLIVFNI